MHELIQMIQTNHNLFFAGPLLWISLCVVASVVYRRSRGKAIWPSKPENCMFYESWTSGHSNSSIFTKLGGARNCLLVAVTPDSLVIQPQFPFNLMFLPEIYGLEYSIPALNIRAVAERGRILGRGVEVEFIDLDGGEKSVRLYLRKTDQFLATMGKLSAFAGNRIEL